MKQVITLCLLTLLFTASSFAQTNSDSLDSRLDSYLTSQIDNEETLGSVKKQFTVAGFTFEDFIKAMFTRKIEFDTTPDNSLALSKLGTYLENERPELSPDLIKELEAFLEKEGNETMMRGMILQTLKGIMSSPKK